MTAIEFAKQFNVWIAGDSSGYIKVCMQKPIKMEKDDFWLTAKEESTFLRSYADDYDDLKKRRCMFLICPDGSDDYSRKEENVFCADYVKDQEIAVEVEVIEVFNSPDLINDGEKHTITMRDENNHDFVYTTKSANIPAKGDKKLLKAKIVGGTASMEFGVPSFEIKSVKLLQSKKK